MAAMIRRQNIELRGALADPVLAVTGWRLGDWAVHEAAGMPGRFTITLLPLGMCLPTDWATFERSGDALRAMIVIVRLRNDWHRIEQADLTVVLKARLQDICSRHRAMARAPVGFAQVADHDFFGLAADRLNGYASPRQVVH